MSTILRVEWFERAQLTYRSGKSRLEWDNSQFDSLGVSPHSSWDFLPRHSRWATLSHSIYRMSTKVLHHSPSFLTIPENSNTNRKCRVRWEIQWLERCEAVRAKCWFTETHLTRVELFSFPFHQYMKPLQSFSLRARFAAHENLVKNLLGLFLGWSEMRQHWHHILILKWGWSFEANFLTKSIGLTSL